MQQSIVSAIVVFYLFVGAALLMFNLFYMFGMEWKSRMRKRRVCAEQQEQATVMENSKKQKEKAYQKRLYQKLRTAEGLLIFEQALEENQKQMPKDKVVQYLQNCRAAIYDAAETYRKRSAMERALFAYFVSTLPQETIPEYRHLGQQMLIYLEDATVYCRENVLKALCSLGNAEALERALCLFQENDWYHSPKLLADGMIGFCGDRVAVAKRLCNRMWNDNIKTALIHVMSQLPDDLTDLVLPELSSKYQEIRFAAIRYFAYHIRQEVAPLLREIVQREEDTAVAAAWTLGKYPGEETKQTLVQALRSRNWYVRHNAAVSLIQMPLKKKEIKALCANEDQYAREMFIYVLESREKKKC